VNAPPPQAGLVSYQGRYAGAVSRLTAYVIDLLLTIGVYYVVLAAISFSAQIVTGNSIHWNRTNIVVAIVFVVWHLFYMGYSWSASGRTFGMAMLGICVVKADGTTVDSRYGFLRALVFPLSFLTLGLGFLGILVQREHRALQDLIAGTAVVYAWDARAARLRFLARQAELGAPGVPQPSIPRPSPTPIEAGPEGA
jgi:uncharacterized RDD family membrane protein YckC